MSSLQLAFSIFNKILKENQSFSQGRKLRILALGAIL